MDKLTSNPWFMRILALLVALLLFVSVSFETKPESASPGILPTSSTHVETITDVPVNVTLDEERYVVSGIPGTVNILLEGSTSDTKTAAMQRDIEVYADLSNLGIGTHTVPLTYKNISDKVNVQLEPSEVSAVIKEKVTMEFPVEIDFLNRNQMKTGYVAEQAIVKPNVVKITGAKEDVEQIALVKALVDLKDVSETVVQEARVAVYDKNQNPLAVTVDPAIVEITVPISSPSKKVPFKIKREGELREGLSILSLESVPNEVTIYGPQDVIDQFEFIDGVTIDLDGITEDTSLEFTIPVPKGVEKVSPEKITVNIDVEEEKQLTFSNLPVQSFGLGNDLALEFVEPSSGTLDVNVFGAPKTVEDMKPSDIELYINVTNLGVGEHEVAIEVNGPQNISWELPKDTITISISEKE